MKNNIVKIVKYDPDQLTPPYRFITIHKVDYSDEELTEVSSNPSRQHFLFFNKIASRMGYVMKFWSTDSEDNTHVIVIEDETTDKLYRIENKLSLD